MEEKMKKILDKYEAEMMAQGAWCGHAYAAEYLSEIRDELLKIFNEIEGQYTYEKGYLYKNGEFCNSAREMSIRNTAASGRFTLEEDYDELISDIYSSKLSAHKKGVIAGALDNEFKTKLAEAVDHLVRMSDMMGFKLTE